MRLGNEVSSMLPVLSKLSAEDDVLAIGPKNLAQGCHIELVCSADQRIRSLLGTIEASDCRGGRSRRSRCFWGLGWLCHRQSGRAHTGHHADNPKTAAASSMI